MIPLDEIALGPQCKVCGIHDITARMPSIGRGEVHKRIVFPENLCSCCASWGLDYYEKAIDKQWEKRYGNS